MKNILITGGAGFLGQKICNYFLNNNTRVICLDNIDEGSSYIKKNLKKYKKKFYYLKCNLENYDEIKNTIKEIKKFNTVDVLINNAAITGDALKKGWNEKFHNQSYDNFERALRVNLLSVFEISKCLKYQMNKSKSPSIINISSIYAKLAHDKKLYSKTNINNPAAYSASKAALDQLTRWLASELSPKIRVNSILPGGIKRKQSKLFINKYISKTLLNRMATEDDILNLVVFLSSTKSSYITGQNIVIDGGYSIK